MDHTPRTDQSAGATVSRRTVVKGAAWAVPVLVIGTAAPAVAAISGACVPDGGTVPGFTVWDVGSRYGQGTTYQCNNHSNHPDYVLKFTLLSGACPTCQIGAGLQTVNAFRITVTLDHQWAWWLAWTSETLTRTYYLRTTFSLNCVDPGNDCSEASYTSAGINPDPGPWTAGFQCNNNYIVVPNSGDTGYDCHATNAVDDGIHINPCWWDTHQYVSIPYTYQAGYESTPGNSATFTPCADVPVVNAFINIPASSAP